MKTEICPIGNTRLEPTPPRQWQKIFSEINAFLRSALYKIKEFEGRIFTVAGSSYANGWRETSSPWLRRSENVCQRGAVCWEAASLKA